MDIKYCHKCRTKIAPDKVCTFVMASGKQRDYCQTCWDLVNKDGKYQTLQQVMKEEANESQFGLKSRRKKKTSLYGSAIVTKAKLRVEKKRNRGAKQKGKKVDLKTAIRRRSSSTSIQTSVRRRDDYYEDDYDYPRRKTSKDPTLVVIGCVVGLGILVFVGLAYKNKARSPQPEPNQVDAQPNTGSQSNNKNTIDDLEVLKDKWQVLLLKESAKEIEPEDLVKMYKTFLAKAKLTSLEKEIKNRIDAVTGYQQLIEMAKETGLKIKGLHEFYQTLRKLKKIGAWEKKIRDVWEQASRKWDSQADELFNTTITPAIDASRKDKNYDKAIAIIDKFLENVEDYEGAPNSWHQLAQEEKDRLKELKVQSGQ